MKFFPEIRLIALAIFVTSSPASSKPNNPPECDPASPQFAAAAQNSVVIVVPNGDFPDLGYVLSGCEQAKSMRTSSGLPPYNCVVIRSEDVGLATEIFERDQIRIQGLMSHVGSISDDNIATVSRQIDGSLILNAKPWQDEALFDSEGLTQYGFESYNMLQRPSQ